LPFQTNLSGFLIGLGIVISFDKLGECIKKLKTYLLKKVSSVTATKTIAVLFNSLLDLIAVVLILALNSLIVPVVFFFAGIYIAGMPISTRKRTRFIVGSLMPAKLKKIDGPSCAWLSLFKD
jgi:hypothetical protein